MFVFSGFGLRGLRLFRCLLLAARESLLLRSVVRARFLFVPLTFVAVEEEDFLSVSAAHTVSVPRCRRAEKRSTMPRREIASVGGFHA